MFTSRSDEKEILDLGPAFYTEEEFLDCQKKLFKINSWLGIFKDSCKLLEKWHRVKSVLDLGCGGGLFILHLSEKFPDIKFEGADIAADAIAIAKKELAQWKIKNPQTAVRFKVIDFEETQITEKVDMVISTLVCHHLSENEIIHFIKDAYKRASILVLIHDLQRSSIAYGLYALLAPILFRNRLITHDGLISIKRGFTRKELKRILIKTEIPYFQIKWKFPFRWEIMLWKA
jgi:2-polyprenyl-3-methyl-5-hydroxy-6-metoxy-1,4-benzoquinol methylase